MRGGGPLFAVDGLLVSQAKAKGMQRVQLLKPERPSVQLPDKVSKVELLADKVNVPVEETTYWCHVMKIPLDMTYKHHIVRVKTRAIFYFNESPPIFSNFENDPKTIRFSSPTYFDVYKMKTFSLHNSV